MDCVSAETEARVRAANDRYVAADAEIRAARAEIALAMAAHQADTGLAIEKIARLTVLSTTQAYRMLTKASEEDETAGPS